MKELIKKNPFAARAIRAARAKQHALASRTRLEKRVAELEARLSVVDGRSSLNAERNVRTHASLQNLAEDFNALKEEVGHTTADPVDAPETTSADT